MVYESAEELENIGAKLIDGIPADYWRGVEDGLELASSLLVESDSQPDASLIYDRIQAAISDLRDKRVVWLMSQVNIGSK